MSASAKGERVMSLRCLLGVAFLVMSATTLHSETDGAGDSAEPGLGSLVGRFLYDGEPPKPGPLSRFHEVSLDKPPSREPVTGRFYGDEIAYREYLERGVRPRTLDESLVVSEDGGIANVIVFVTSADIPSPAPESDGPQTVTLEIKEGQFVPRVLGVTASQTLVVENRDRVTFDFDLKSLRNPPVNLLVPPKSARRLTFSTGEKAPRPFRSNHQSWATGILLIHGNPYFAVSGADGTFAISGLPPGRWEFRAWHERVGYLKHWPKGRFTLEIKPGKNGLGSVKLSPDLFNR